MAATSASQMCAPSRRPSKNSSPPSAALFRQIASDAVNGGPTTLEAYKKASQTFQTQLVELQSTRGTADAALGKLEKDTAAGKSLLALYQIEVDRDIEAATRAHERLTQLIPRTAPANSETKVPDHLLKIRQLLVEESAKFPDAQHRRPKTSRMISRHRPALPLNRQGRRRAKPAHLRPLRPDLRPR